MKPRDRLLAVPLSAAFACCQGEPPAPPPTPAPQQPAGDAATGRATAAAMLEQFKQQKIDVDLAAGTVTIDAVANLPPDPIEYLLIHRSGKRHEAMFWTMSKPSVLNAALLLLGLEPGKNATCKEKEPPPTLAEIEQGADPLVVTPPQGKEFYMTVRWQAEDGTPREFCVEDLIYDLALQAPMREAGWVYLGGRLASIYKGEPEEFVADLEGNLVSVCYLSPDNHLGTMRHERARDDQNWWLTDKVPPHGTEVKFVFHKQKSKLHAARELRLRSEPTKPAADGKHEVPAPAPQQGR